MTGQTPPDAQSDAAASGATILGCAGPDLAPSERDFFRDADPWGFILFARNVDTPDRLRALTGDLRDAVGRDAPVFVDQEGGRVARLRPPDWRDWPPALDMAQTGGARAMYLRARLIADDLRRAGIDGNCAPLADIAGDGTHPFLRNRCYGTGLRDVVACARATADGLMAGGVLPVVKHMPGHGRAQADSHKDLPVVEATLHDLRGSDFAAFRALSDLPLGMTAHIVFPALDPDAPATLSRAAMDEVRGWIGFDGLVMTDDLSMHALSGTMAARAAAARVAGCDIVLHCNGDRAEMEGAVAGAGRMDADGAARAAHALACRHAPDTADLASMAAELADLTGWACDV
ncbi:glycoside hydrolase family 3 N-terminal domain-containing protein [Meridianimarinicoccus sp. RP-17]|uniref:glycoside hydrolase family 3 N-terminal domain-containing protein n=1 Tax=Meridianimarinicoccus zhengii TaxID=2056810 RepID=UPI000DAB8195|nr:glycoside hydrolase family 3 N-terminal domain-containing protein [Phycocomes zhengii]